jgi:hypothetical protein
MADSRPFHGDPRVTPARPDLAAKHLEGKVQAARFVEGDLREAVAPNAPVRREPRPDASVETEVLKGEAVMVYESSEEGWSWGQLLADGYVGWIPTEALCTPGPAPTHRVTALRTLTFPGPSSKLAPIEALSMGCAVTIIKIKQAFAVTTAGAFVPSVHLASADAIQDDFVAVAERFRGVPYLWGGRTSFGLDCSALVQLSLAACGHACLRDSDMQEQTLGAPIAPAADFSNLMRGDLLFWPGHVAIARDPATLIHANVHHMAVAIEPIVEAVARIRTAGSELSSIRRIAGIIQ